MSQRIIKFRAWDKCKKIFAKQITTYKLDRNNNIILVVYLNKANKLGEIYNEDLVFCNEFELIQFTGFFDRNGVEIYEGDVIESTDITMEGQNLTYSGVVCFSNGWYAIETFVTDGYPSCFIPFSTNDLPLILGNKFENPELLK